MHKFAVHRIDLRCIRFRKNNSAKLALENKLSPSGISINNYFDSIGVPSFDNMVKILWLSWKMARGDHKDVEWKGYPKW